MLTISSGYDPGYLTRAVATGRENYYLSAVAEHGEPPGIWTGLGCPELGLPVGSRVDSKVMERLYGAFIDPRDPEYKATLGRAPSRFAGNDDRVCALIAERLAAEPEATAERRDQIIMQAMREQRATVYFFDATFSVPKSVSLLHASLQVRAQRAREAGQVDEAQAWEERASTVWEAIMAANQAMLAYLQREAGYSRAGYHSKGSGRFVDAHEWVIASFPQHTSRDNDPQLHVHNAILNRVLREDPLATRPGDRRAWRTLDGAALYAIKPAAGAIAERTLAEQLSARLGVETIARLDGNGWEIAGISEELRDQFSSRRRAIEPRVRELIEEYERKHGRAPNARAVWSMAQFVTLDSRQAKAHSAPSREALLARWEAQSRRAETGALSAIPDAALGRRDPAAAPPAASADPSSAAATRGFAVGTPNPAAAPPNPAAAPPNPAAAPPNPAAAPPNPAAAPPELPGEQIDRILAAAVADAQQRKATFTRYELTRMVNRYLPDFLGGLTGEQVTRLLDELTSEALRPGGPAGTVLLTAPEMVPVPARHRRADGLSLWRRHGAEVYTTRAMLDTETRLLRAAAQTGAPAVEPERAAAALGADRTRVEARLWRGYAHPGAADGAASTPDGAVSGASGAGRANGSARTTAHGAADLEGAESDRPDDSDSPLSSAGLVDDQAQAAYGVLTSGRAIDILVGPAGTGKTRTVATIAHVWRDAGLGRVIGLTTSTNAAHMLAAEGLAESHNFAQFLGRIKDSDRTRGHLPVRPGDLLVVDEASMVSTADLAAVEEIATRWGAKILLTGDTEQLSAPQAGGAMKLLADEHGFYQLNTVQRFDQEWEREASTRLRAGDADVLAEYDQRGRLLEGTREEMTDAACRRWLADHLSGKHTMLLATTNVQAAELARGARDELAALGLVATGDLIELADGNLAGVGDLIVARENTRIPAGAPGRRLANRDVLRIDAWEERGEERVAVVRRVVARQPFTGKITWSGPFELPGTYIERHVALAYAGNVHVAEGQTVDTGHLVVDDTAGRAGLYVGMSRGRERNTAYVVTERAHAADLSPQPRPAPELADPGADAARHTGRFAVLGEVLGREQTERTATETMRRELEHAASLATLAPIWAEVTRREAISRYENELRRLLAPSEWQRYSGDPQRGPLVRLLRAAELAGHDGADVLRRAVAGRDFAGARSVAAVLHGRVQWLVGTPEPLTWASYAERTPVSGDAEEDRFVRDVAAAMDARVAVLGDRAALDRPVWALRYLGEVPVDPVERAEWVRRAGVVAAYREERGFADEAEAIGPAPERGSPEQRASWHAAYAALRMPDAAREAAAATDGELWARRGAYEREAGWAPPYVTAELREAHLAEDTYRADAVRAWYRAEAATDEAERDEARREAEAASTLAQEVGGRREALAEVAEARREWHTATEVSRQEALMADSELRRRYPDLELPPLHPPEEPGRAEQEAEADEVAPDADAEAADSGAGASRPDADRVDIEAALAAARRARQILAERERQADRESELDSDDVMRRREVQARQAADARRGAVRQEPAPSYLAMSLERDELELEAGQ